MPPACSCEVSNDLFNTQLAGGNFKTKDQPVRLPSCFPLLQSALTCFCYSFLLISQALELEKALWMGQYLNSTSKGSKVVFCAGLCRLAQSCPGQHRTPGICCGSGRWTSPEEEGSEKPRGGWRQCRYVAWSNGRAGGRVGWQVNKTRLKWAWTPTLPQAAHVCFSAPHFSHKCYGIKISSPLFRFLSFLFH